MIRVILADDHHLVRNGIRALIEKASDFEVIGEVSDGQEAIELVDSLEPDVLLMDIGMPRLNGIQATERVRALNKRVKVLILSMHSGPLLVRKALQAGAKGYLLKRSVTEELLLAIRAVSQGETYLSPPVAGIVTDGFLMSKPENSENSLIDALTSREREVLQLIAEGNTNPGIAEKLSISISTVERHRANLMAKLDAHDVAGLTRFAIQNGLIFLEE
jgi:DNA-binding NarL/FixJ family response regulator